MYFPTELFSHIISYLKPDPIREQTKQHHAALMSELIDHFEFMDYVTAVDYIYSIWSNYIDLAGNISNYTPYQLTDPLE